jgi:hypothetical protein
MIKNYLTEKNSPEGTRAVDLYEIWGNSDFKNNID